MVGAETWSDGRGASGVALTKLLEFRSKRARFSFLVVCLMAIPGWGADSILYYYVWLHGGADHPAMRIWNCVAGYFSYPAWLFYELFGWGYRRELPIDLSFTEVAFDVLVYAVVSFGTWFLLVYAFLSSVNPLCRRFWKF